MAVCHAKVQRILLEAADIIDVDPATTPVCTVMDPPARLDMIPILPTMVSSQAMHLKSCEL